MQKSLIIFSVVIILTLFGYIVYDKVYPVNTQQSTNIPTANNISASPNNQHTPTPVSKSLGVIEGSISFPSETIPSDLTVCAETTSGDQFKCTNEQIKNSKYTYGAGYKLELPPGNYYVYSRVPSMQNDYRAYYNEFVVCGLSVDCPSHKNIVVKVLAGETINKIDPQDWYNQTQ